MTCPATRAHIRVLEQAQLTVRTHERVYIDHVQVRHVAPKILIRGKIYDSMTAAAKALRKTRWTIRRWMETGEAKYA